MTENEAIKEMVKMHPKTCKMVNGRLKGGFDDHESDEGIAFDMAINVLEEVQQYRAVGTPEECLRNKDFLDFLSDKMNPNDFETYLRIYNALDEKGNSEAYVAMDCYMPSIEYTVQYADEKDIIYDSFHLKFIGYGGKVR